MNSDDGGRLSYIMENMHDAYFEAGPQGNFLCVNRSFCDILGYSRAELLSMNFRAISTPEYLSGLAENTKKIIADPFAGTDIVTEIIRKDGERRSMEFSVSFVRGPAGEPAVFRGIGRDITEKIQANHSIRDSEERYKLLADNLTDVIWVLDPEMTFLYVSPSVMRLRGYTPEEAMSHTLDQTLTLESFKRATEVFAREYQLEQSGQKHGKDWSINLELEMNRKDGSTVWTDVKLNILYDDQGEAVGLLGVTRDITERKKAEDVLKTSEALYRTIFEHTATANMIIAQDTTILMVNSNFETLTGYARAEVEHQMSWTKLVFPDDVAEMVRRHKMRRSDPTAVPNTYEFKGVIRSGEVRHFFMSVAMIPGTRNSIASLIDITARKEMEDALKRSEERFREMASLLPEAVFEVDAAGYLTFVNEISFSRFGYSHDDFNAGLNVMNFLATEDHERAYRTFQQMLAGEEMGLSEYLARRKDGSTFPALVHTSRILVNGKPAGARGFLIDISEKKALEEQLLSSQKLEAIGTLAGGIAHDFNNLLMGILGNLSLMLLDIDENSPIYERIKSVEEYIQRGSDLTRQLLGFARGGKYEVRSTDIAVLTRRSAEMFGRARKEISIHLEASENLRPVNIDRGQMDQVLLNLFMNAWQAMPGGGHIYISLENENLSEGDAGAFDVFPGLFVKLKVRDTGIGMDEATQARIFEPFFTTKERGRGTGLGLASVYGIIKNHGGFIRVESKKGAGASFIIYLPASDKDVEKERHKDETIHRGRETILFIDDEEMIVDVNAQLLEGLGYKVLTAQSGREGLAIFEANKDAIDLVILDMIMPDMNGRETFDALKRLSPSVSVLLSSGYSLDSQAQYILNQGCKGFIQKPFSTASLSAKVREILEAK